MYRCTGWFGDGSTDIPAERLSCCCVSDHGTRAFRCSTRLVHLEPVLSPSTCFAGSRLVASMFLLFGRGRGLFRCSRAAKAAEFGNERGAVQQMNQAYIVLA